MMMPPSTCSMPTETLLIICLSSPTVIQTNFPSSLETHSPLSKISPSRWSQEGFDPLPVSMEESSTSSSKATGMEMQLRMSSLFQVLSEDTEAACSLPVTFFPALLMLREGNTKTSKRLWEKEISCSIPSKGSLARMSTFSSERT
jgi:hypothetical protein